MAMTSRCEMSIFRSTAVSALEDREQAPIAAVDIITNLKFAGVVDERCLVGQIDRDKGRELDIDLARSEHFLDAILSVAVSRTNQRQQHFGIVHRILHAHAPVAESPLV